MSIYSPKIIYDRALVDLSELDNLSVSDLSILLEEYYVTVESHSNIHSKGKVSFDSSQIVTLGDLDITSPFVVKANVSLSVSGSSIVTKFTCLGDTRKVLLLPASTHAIRLVYDLGKLYVTVDSGLQDCDIYLNYFHGNNFLPDKDFTIVDRHSLSSSAIIVSTT
jgi:hypothetical protein